MGVRIIGALVIVAAVGCGSSTPHTLAATPPAADAPAAPIAAARSIAPESFQWKLKLRGLELARMTLTSTAVPNRPGLTQLISTVKTSGVGRFVRYVERRTVTVVRDGVALSAWALKREQSTWRRVYTRFSPGTATVISEYESNSDLARRPSLHGDTIFNGETALAALRQWRPAEGEIAEMVALAETRHWWVQFRARPGGTRKYRGLPHETLVIEGVMWRMSREGQVERDREPRRMTLWLTHDEARLPLRIEFETKFGDVVATLK